MTPRADLLAHREDARRRVRIDLARENLIDFVRHVSRAPGGYRPDACHFRLCRALERFSAAVAAGESPRLIVVMPPRNGKSEIVSRNWPVWHLAQHDKHEFACASYGQELADDMSRDAREVARSDAALEVFPDLAPKVPKKRYYADYRRSDVDKVSLWKVGRGGSYKAIGVGGPFTGRGAHIVAIDDPFKDRAEADSETRRNHVWNWYLSTAYTRIAPGGGVIVMATRWHEDDLIGRLLKAQETGGDQWEVLHLEAIASADEVIADEDAELAEEVRQACGDLPVDEAGRPCWRLAGEALHPKRYPLSRLLKIKAAITQLGGVREWEALYQGRPVPLSGNHIKREWFEERYSCRPEDLAATADEVWVTVDAAKKGTNSSDTHSMQVWARKGSKKYVLDRVCDRMGYPEFRTALDALIAKWRAHLVRRGGALIEDTANGTTYMQERGPAYLGVPLIAFHPNKDTPGDDKGKGARATYLERDAEARAIILPDPSIAPWVGDMVTWWCAFPLGRFDDDVDAASQLLMRWMLQAAVTQPSPARALAAVRSVFGR